MSRHGKSTIDSVSELRRLDPSQRAEALQRFSSAEALAIFEQLEPPLQEELLEWLPAETVDQLVMDLDPDDRVRLLDTLTNSVAGALLASLSPREWRLTRKLLSYPKESAGHIMMPEYLPLTPSLTAALFLSGSNAVTEAGQLVNLDMVGNRIGAITFGPTYVARWAE
jgi:magnesium transporter